MSQLLVTCPYGGNFFVCERNTTEFIGCCTTDPRHDGKGICPQENLRNVSFSPASFAKFMPQDCVDDSSSWYTYNFTSPPFLGCCRTNPCAAPCAQVDLASAKLSIDAVARSAFIAGAQPATNVTVPQPTSPEGSGALSLVPPAKTITEAMPTSTEGSSGVSTPIIIGVAIGTAAVVVLIAQLMYSWGRSVGKRATARPAGPETERISERLVPARAQPADILPTNVLAVLIQERHDDLISPERAFPIHRYWPVTVRTDSFQHGPSYDHNGHDFVPAPVDRTDVLPTDVPTALRPGRFNDITSPTDTVISY